MAACMHAPSVIAHAQIQIYRLLLCSQQIPQLAANMSEVLLYSLTLTVNSTTVFNATVAADITTVDIFGIFSRISRAFFTNYSLRIAAVNNIRLSGFTEPVSVGETMLSVKQSFCSAVSYFYF